MSNNKSKHTIGYSGILTDELFNLKEIYGDVELYLSLKEGIYSPNIFRLIREDLKTELEVVLNECRSSGVKVSGRLCEFLYLQESNFVKLVAEPIRGDDSEIRLYKIFFESGEAKRKYDTEGSCFQFILENIDVAIWCLDVESGMLNIRGKMTEMLDIDEVISIEKWESRIHTEDIRNVREIFEENKNGKTSYCEIEYRRKSRKDEWIYLHTKGKVTERDKQGNATRIIGVHFDITEKEEEALKNDLLNDRYSSIINSMAEGVIILDMEGNFIYHNKSVERILGLEEDQLKGITRSDSSWKLIKESGEVFPVEEFPSYVSVKTGLPVNNVVMGVCIPNKEVVWVMNSSQLLYSPGSKIPYGVFVIFYDITASKNYERQLQVRKQRLKDIFEAANLGTWERDIQTGRVTNNEQFMTYLGYSIEELGYRNYEEITELCNSEDLKLTQEILNRHIAGELEYYEVEVRIRHKLGHWVWIMSKGKIIEWTEEGNPKTMFGIHLDISGRKKVEEELHENQRFLSSVISNLPGYVFRVNNDTEYTPIYISDQVESITGYKSSEYLNKTVLFQTNVVKEDSVRVKKIVSDAIESKEQYDCEYNIYTKSGVEKTLWERARGVYDGNGKLLYVEGFVVDVSVSKNLEKEKALLLNRFEKISYNLPGFIYQYQIDPNGKAYFSFASQGSNRLFGINPVDLEDLGKAFRLVHKDDINGLKRSLINAIKNKVDWSYEWRCIIDRKTIWLGGSSNLEIMPDGTTVFYGYIFDITDRKKSEEDLYRLSLVAQNTSNIVIITNERRRITWVNEGFTRITGYSLEEVIGKNPGVLLQSDESDRATIAGVRSKLNSNESARFEILNKGKDGRRYWLDVEIQPLTLPSGKLIGFMAIETEITERKNFEIERTKMLQELIRNNLELLQFSYIVSHNLRGPVASILGLVNLFTLLDKSEIDSVHNMIKDAALSLDSVIKDLNEILDLRKPSESKKFVVFGDVQKNVLGMLGNSLSESKAEIFSDYTKLDGIYSIRGHLQSIFYNIISNSIKYKKNDYNPVIHITTYKDDRYAYIMFKDNGIGIDMDRYKGKIFGLYQRFSLQAEGKGIGLYLVKSNTQALGGEVYASSQLGNGLEILVKLPLENQL